MVTSPVFERRAHEALQPFLEMYNYRFIPALCAAIADCDRKVRDNEGFPVQEFYERRLDVYRRDLTKALESDAATPGWYRLAAAL